MKRKDIQDWLAVESGPQLNDWSIFLRTVPKKGRSSVIDRRRHLRSCVTSFPSSKFSIWPWMTEYVRTALPQTLYSNTTDIFRWQNLGARGGLAGVHNVPIQNPPTDERPTVHIAIQHEKVNFETLQKKLWYHTAFLVQAAGPKHQIAQHNRNTVSHLTHSLFHSQTLPLEDFYACIL